jgi:formylglycine-generating enzyme required for sulfatase activity
LPEREFTMGAALAESKHLGLPDFWATRGQPPRVVLVAKPLAITRYEITRGEFARFACAL